MKIPEHIALSYLLAQLGVQLQYGPWGTGLMIAAGCLPDLDGVTLLAGWRYYRAYHRILGHGILVTLAGPLALAGVGAGVLDLGPLAPLWLWLLAAQAGHLLTDMYFYRWPVQLLWPFSRRGWGVGLLAWNDLVPTLLLYGAVAAAVAWPAFAPAAAGVGIGGLAGYLVWRAWQPEPLTAWGAWLAGDWARHSPRFWKWLTGDFIT